MPRGALPVALQAWFLTPSIVGFSQMARPEKHNNCQRHRHSFGQEHVADNQQQTIDKVQQEK